MLDPLLIVELGVLGLATGFLAGLLGIGGGMLLVPFLTYILGAQKVAPDLAVKMAIGACFELRYFSTRAVRPLVTITSESERNLPRSKRSKSVAMSSLFPVSPNDLPAASTAKFTRHPLQIPYSLAISHDCSSLDSPSKTSKFGKSRTSLK